MSRKQTFRVAIRNFAPFQAAIRAQWQEFESQHRTGLQLDAVSMDLQQLEESLFDAGGMKSGAWDVAFVSTDWTASMHRQGAAVDLSPMLARDAPLAYPEGWTPSLLQLQSIDDAVLGVPYHDGPACLVYRSDVFSDAALREEYRKAHLRELAPPETWEEFHRTARFLQRPERELYGAVFAAFPDGHNSVYDFLLQLWSRGGEFVDASGQLRLQTTAAVEALTFYRALLADTSAVYPDCAKLDSVAAGKVFADGHAAMMINWFGFAALAHAGPGSAVRSRVDIAAVPHGEGGSAVSLNVYWLLAIASGSPHPELAWAFLKHVLTPQMDKLTTLSGGIGCRRSTWHDFDVNQAIPFYHRLESLHKRARQIPRRADWPRIAAVIDELVVAALYSNTPATDLLQKADAKLNRDPRP